MRAKIFFMILCNAILLFGQPGAFSLTSPVNGGWAHATQQFFWGASTGAIYYQLWFDGILKADSIPVNNFTLSSSVTLPDGMHTWHVVAINGGGQSTQSTETWSVKSDATFPNAFDLVSPADMQWDTARPTFQWSASGDAGSGLRKYQLWIDSTVKIDSISPVITSITPGSSQALSDGIRRWFVKAFDIAGNSTKSSRTYGVHIDNSPPGVTNNAVYFDGTDDYIAIPNNYQLSPGRITIEAWIYTTQSGASQTILFNEYYLVLLSTGCFRFAKELGWGSVDATMAISSYQWHHVACVVTGSAHLIYVDGVLAGTRSIDYLISPTKNPFYAGKFPNPFGDHSFFRGYIDEIRVWNYARSQAEIQTYKNRILSGNEPGLVGYWRLNEGNGAITSDYSQSGNNGTLMNGAYFSKSDLTGVELGELCKLLSPPEGIFFNNSPKTFTWTQTADTGIGFGKYQFIIDGAVVQDNLTDTTFTLTTPLSNGKHSWWVAGYDQLGNHQASAMRYVNIDLLPPNQFNLVAPADGAGSGIPTPTFSWAPCSDDNTGSGLRKYQLWIDSVLNIDSIAPSKTSTAPAAPLIESPHKWHVVAIDNVGNARLSSQTWTIFVDFNPPDSFALISPVTWDTVKTDRPLFVWRPAKDIGSGIECYWLFVSGFMDTIKGSDTTFLSPRSLSNGTYTWDVGALDRAGQVRYSAVDTFVVAVQPPAAPVLSYPSNSATDQPLTVTLAWNPAAGAVTYRVQLSADSTFAGTIINDSSLTAVSKAAGPLAIGTTFYWRVNAKNTGGTGSWSDVWRFTTIPPAPAAPALVSPSNSATNQPLNPTLAWNQVSGANTYRVQVATNASFTSIVADDSSLIATNKEIGPLSTSMTYYWRVNAKNAGGASAWSGAWRFTTVPPAPVPPTLVSPVNGAVGISTSPTLLWNTISGAVTYHVQVCFQDNTFATLYTEDSTLTGISTFIGPLSNATTYFWRVRAKNAGGASAWSSIWSFYTAATAIVGTAYTDSNRKPFAFAASPSIADWDDERMDFYCVSDARREARLTIFDAVNNTIFKADYSIPASKKPVLFGTWDLKTRHGKNAGAGMYIAVLECRDESGRATIVKRYVGIKAK